MIMSLNKNRRRLAAKKIILSAISLTALFSETTLAANAENSILADQNEEDLMLK